MPQEVSTPLARNSAARSSLKRSDSYKAARPILSPEVARRSVENSAASSARTSANTSVNISLDISNSSAELPRVNGKDVEIKTKMGAAETKGNFFKTIRSQFSFSSLRRKNPKKSLNKTVEVKKANDNMVAEQNLKRSQSFSAVKSPTAETRPVMTSTPVSEEERRTGEEIQRRREQPAFRTAAMKSQHQRWSFAEAQLHQHQLPPGYQYGQPAHQHHPAAYMVQHQHHQHGHHHYATYGHSSSHSGSRRSSLSSVYGTTHEPGCVNHPHHPASGAPSPAWIERPAEGAYGYSVLRAGSVGRSQAGPRPAARPAPACPGGCPMCYHSTKSPCAHCGCPSSAPAARARPALPTPEFFSPTSDYHSLSPSSPPPSSPPSSASPPPIYATVNKAKVGSPEREPRGEVREAESPVRETRPELRGESEELRGERKELRGESKELRGEREELRGEREELRGEREELRGEREELRGKMEEPVPEDAGARGERPPAPEPRKSSLPLLPERRQGESRRHSWAGARGQAAGPRGQASDRGAASGPRQTSLQDFKRLLAAQTPGSNPHRVSATDLLGRREEPGDQGSIRRRNSPWKDQRFSVIQEEPGEEGRSRESLLSSRR